MRAVPIGLADSPVRFTIQVKSLENTINYLQHGPRSARMMIEVPSFLEFQL